MNGSSSGQMERRLTPVVEGFRRSVGSVEELLGFDRFVLDEVVGGLSALASGLEARGRNNEAASVRNRVDAIRSIRRSDSLRPRYETMVNQCVVLLVSYFGATVGDVFRNGVSVALAIDAEVPAALQKIEVTWKQLSRSERTTDLIADALISQQKVSFQDMKSTARAFRETLHLEVSKTGVVNDIILGQAARHAIVHCGGMVDDRLLVQVQAATPRTLKPSLTRGMVVRFDPQEVVGLAQSMTAYVDAVVARLIALADRVDQAMQGSRGNSLPHEGTGEGGRG